MKRPARRGLSRLVSGSIAALTCAACADTAPGEAPSAPSLRFAGLGTCSASGNGDGQFPSNADRVVIELAGGSAPQPFRTQAAAGAATAEGDIVVEGVPVGTGMTLRAAACSGATTLWAGRTTGVDVAEFQKSFPSVFLTPLGVLTCTGNASTPTAARALSEPRAFAALATSGDAAYALGGGKKLTAQGANITIDGTQTIDRYDATTGEIAAAGTLTSVRVGALARPLADGRIRVIGGATTLRVAAAGRPGIFAEGSASPASASEIYDPATATSTVEAATPLAAMPALGVVASGAVVAAGGSRGAAISDELVILTGASSSADTVPGGGRFGALVVPLGGELALVWGGNVSGAVADVGALVDAAQPADAAASALTVSGAADVPYGAAGVLLGASAGTAQVLVVGGGLITAAGAFESPHLGAARLQLLTIDTAAETVAVTAIGLGDVGGDALKRAFGVLAALPDGDVAFLGGFTAFTSVPSICSAGADCLQASIVRMRVDDLDTAPVAAALTPTLAVNGGPLGSNVVALPDGAWFLTGGVDTIATVNLAKDPGLFRYEDLSPDLCAELPPAATP